MAKAPFLSFASSHASTSTSSFFPEEMTLVLLHTSKSGISKEVCNKLEEIVSKYHPVRSLPFKQFGKSTFSKNTVILFVSDHDFPAELHKVQTFLEKQDEDFLREVKFSMLIYGDDKGKPAPKDIADFAKLRSKLVGLGGIDFLGDRVSIVPTNFEVNKVIPTILNNLKKQVTVVDFRRPSFVAPQSWGLLDPGTAEFHLFVEKFRKNVPISSQTWAGDQMQNCFLGSEAVDWICQHAEAEFELTREQALGIGQKMLQAGVFSHITNELAFKDKPIVYKLYPQNETAKKWKAPPEWD